MLKVGDTLVSLAFLSDGTHLSNFDGDKHEWPVYTTIGNLSLNFHQMASRHSVVLFALLPISITNRNIPQPLRNVEQHTHREEPNYVIWQVLQPFTLKHIPAPRAGITTFSVQRVTSVVGNRF
jgi:hypothetical protein